MGLDKRKLRLTPGDSVTRRGDGPGDSVCPGLQAPQGSCGVWGAQDRNFGWIPFVGFLGHCINGIQESYLGYDKSFKFCQEACCGNESDFGTRIQNVELCAEEDI